MKLCQLLYSAWLYIILYISALIKTFVFRAKVIYTEQTAEYIFIFKAYIV